MKKGVIFLAASLRVLPLLAVSPNLFPEGDFFSDRGRPRGWVADDPKLGWMRDRFRVVEDEGRRFVRVSQAPGVIQVAKPVDPAWGQLELRFQSRRQGIRPGRNAWDVPFAELDLLDAGGKSLLTYRKSIWLPRDTEGWETVTRTYDVPAEAVTLVARIGYKADGGTADFADLVVVPAAERPAAEQAAMRARIATATRAREAAKAAAEAARRTLRQTDPARVTGARIDESVVQVVLHVDAAVAEGGDGSAERPFRTFGAALEAAAPNLAAGRATKIALAAGTYREGNHIVRGGDMNARRAGDDTLLVIEGAASGQTVISGSDVFPPADWRKLDTPAQVIYAHVWTHDFGNVEGPWGQYNPRKLLGHRSEQVFVNGTPLRQVILEDYDYKRGTGWRGRGEHTYKGFLDPAATLTPGTFGVAEREENGNRIFVCPPAEVDWGSAKIEVSVRRHLLHTYYKSGLVLRNLVFEHAASTHCTTHAAVMIGHWHHLQRQLQNNDILVERVVVRRNNGFGMKLGHGRNVTVRDSVFQYNGHSGVNTGVIANFLMERCDLSYNNWRGHLGGLYGWAVAGIKLHQMYDCVLRGLDVYGNMAPGIWFDVNNSNCTIEDVTVVANRRNLFLEISDGPFLIRRALSVADRHVNLVLTNHGHLTVEDSILHGAAQQLVSVCSNVDRGSSNSIEAALGLEPLIGEGGLEVVGDKPKRVHLVGPTRFVNSVLVNPKGRLVLQDPSNPQLYQDWLDHLLTVERCVWFSADPRPFGVGYTTQNMVDHGGWLRRRPTEQSVFDVVPFANAAAFDFRLPGALPGGLDVAKLPAKAIDPVRLDAIRAFFAAYGYGGAAEYADDPLAVQP